MSKENRYAPLLAASSSDVYIKDPNKSSRISYTRSFLLSLAKAKADSYRMLKMSKEIKFAMSCMYEGSIDLLPSPYSELDSDSPKVYASKVLDNVNLLHKSNKPYLPPCRNKALSSSSGDSNGSLKTDISGSSECTNQEVQAELDSSDCSSRNVSPAKLPKSEELWETYLYLEPPLIHDVQIQQDSELKSSNTSFEDCSSSISGFSFPDEDSLVTYDGPFSTLEVEIPPSIDSFMSSPESNLTEDDLDSPDSTFEMIKSLIESVLDGDDDDYDDDYYNFDKDNSSMDDIMSELVQHRARVAKLNLSYPQLNLGRGLFSVSSHSCLCGKICHSDHELRRFGLGAGESMFQQGIMPSLEVPSWKEKTNLMQNCFEYQHPGYDCSVKGTPDSLGDGNGVIGSFEDRKLGASQFMGGFY
ncbi:uncharacterized protein LOC131627556 [Vicia villosa]|uniref:uncharacterized protein LOC131627556 n=1 Tax=Vicia villosa TaxID=3911 RepID=UPI00273BFE6D|nr:uncharacterized protein LOC131627556 [Vicia villosa]